MITPYQVGSLHEKLQLAKVSLIKAEALLAKAKEQLNALSNS